ncbi:hypothetical protein DENSPDRAFT_535666 [Dentipellis sp. KUC8613]|nr:hypothetical protein DENSPDRAFT_535666 [Dentipellis sp. KUC8613]
MIQLCNSLVYVLPLCQPFLQRPLSPRMMWDLETQQHAHFRNHPDGNTRGFEGRLKESMCR